MPFPHQNFPFVRSLYYFPHCIPLISNHLWNHTPLDKCFNNHTFFKSYLRLEVFHCCSSYLSYLSKQKNHSTISLYSCHLLPEVFLSSANSPRLTKVFMSFTISLLKDIKSHCRQKKKICLLSLLVAPPPIQTKNTCLVHFPVRTTVACTEFELLKATSIHYCV